MQTGIPVDPRTCADVGIYGCCNGTFRAYCEVFADGQYVCSCDISCHSRGDCCADVPACPSACKLSLLLIDKIHNNIMCCIVHVPKSQARLCMQNRLENAVQIKY